MQEASKIKERKIIKKRTDEYRGIEGGKRKRKDK